MSNGSANKLNSCGCCAAMPQLQPPQNRAGLTAMSYRLGTYSTFLREMLVQLHSVAIPDGPNAGTRPLATLTTRAADDPSIALLDAWAIVNDVLTFYQERIANEGYLRTATERLSVLQLARAIGYELSPGVAASTYLAFTVDTTPGAPAAVTVPTGTKVQNVPAQGNLPQTFETTEDIQAVAACNALTPRLTRPQELALVSKDDGTLDVYMLALSTSFPADSNAVLVDSSRIYPLGAFGVSGSVKAIPIGNVLYFSGTTTNVQTGDRLLLVGRNDNNPQGVQTKVLIVRDVEVDAQLNRTKVDLRDDLGQSPALPPFELPDAPPVPLIFEDPSFNLENAGLVLNSSAKNSDFSAWINTNSWPALDTQFLRAVTAPPPPPPPPAPNPLANLPLPDPGIFAMRTHVGVFGNNAPLYSSLLAPAGQGFDGSGNQRSSTASGPPNYLYPFDWDKSGWDIWTNPNTNIAYSGDGVIYLEQVAPAILRDSWVVLDIPNGDPNILRARTISESAMAGFGLSGRCTVVELAQTDGTEYIPDGTAKKNYKVRSTVVYAQSEALDLADLPIADEIPAGTTDVMLDSLVLGLSVGQLVAWSGSRTPEDAPGVTANEVLIIYQITQVKGYTVLQFANPLLYSYVRNTVTINANVAPATHGETVNEVLGSGDASQTNQSFTLKRPPLTYVAAATATGGQSTLQVRVNNLLWQEAPSLFGAAPTDQDYIVRREDDGTTSVTFGDGTMGARLPSGSRNVAATYRTGIGLSGNLDAGSLTLLQTRPPGIRAVNNPVAAGGAANPEDLDHARQNAPLKVLTLDRIVSLDDYENFAQAFAGIGKAQAASLWTGDQQVVHLTVAGADGAAVDTESALYSALLGAIYQAHDSTQQVLVANYQRLFFDVNAAVLVDAPRYIEGDVFDAVTTALQDAFSFAARSFAQPVTAAEVTSIIQSVPGVIASELIAFFPVTRPIGFGRSVAVPAILSASPARLSGAAILPAQLLLINPAGIFLQEMQP